MGALALALLLVASAASAQPAAPKEEPYSCVQLREMERKCADAGSHACYVAHEVARLRQQCIRDGGRP
jgi:hypothetical protein